MGIFDRFKRKKKLADEEFDEVFFPNAEKPKEGARHKEGGADEEVLLKERWDFGKQGERREFIRSHCEKLVEAKRGYGEAKLEYKQINAYLSDMQLIDGVEGENRKRLEDAARNIVTLTRERSEYLNRTSRISQEQYGRMDKYREGMEKELGELKRNEDYGLKIRSDLNHLEREKESLLQGQKEIIDKQYFLKQLSIITVALVLSLFLLFLVLHRITDMDVVVPYLLTILFAMVVFFYIFYEAQRNKRENVLVEQKLNRAVALTNKVKIKYVNNTNYLDSVYARLQVEDATELEYVWKQYLLAKEEERKHRENVKSLTKNGEALVALLRGFNVSDAEVWIYQATAILDHKEMVEIRRRLNTRRQKVRERMDYNQRLRKEGEGGLRELISRVPGSEGEVRDALLEFRVELSEE